MKKIILSLAAVFAFSFANAQESTTDGGFAKGDVFVSGSFGFSSEKTGDLKSNGFEFSPAVGFFLTENIALGGRLGIMSEKNENGSAETKMNGFGVEAFGRYYMTPASKFSVFGELAVGIGSFKTEVGPAETKSKTFGVNAGIGVNYFLSSNWAIEAGWAGLGYNTDDNGGNGADKTNTFGLNVDLSSINFGLIYKF
ncbi:outer membrane beta-barrel protein [Flavobacterium sp.]|uniref:outer membrane beta-barrel protein n=1 Tax=Flavobacterium sp. TaxID=239 RepID=UPI002FDA25AD